MTEFNAIISNTITTLITTTSQSAAFVTVLICLSDHSVGTYVESLTTTGFQYDYSRNYELYRNGNLCKGTKHYFAGVNSTHRLVTTKKITGFSRIYDMLNLLFRVLC